MFKFTDLFLEYKNYIESNSQYGVKVVKDFNYNNSHFPIIDFNHQDSRESNDSTVDKIEYYDNEYLEVVIYAKDAGGISRNIITEELVELTHKFLGKYKGMKRTSCRPIPNMDTTVLRTLMSYEFQYGNVRGNIIRR